MNPTTQKLFLPNNIPSAGKKFNIIYEQLVVYIPLLYFLRNEHTSRTKILLIYRAEVKILTTVRSSAKQWTTKKKQSCGFFFIAKGLYLG